MENTYLSTFRALGGLGLLLGTVGLAAVLMRNVLERRRELALLRAVGYRPRHLFTMVLAENVFLLLMGLATGAVCAALATAPAVSARGGHVPVASLGVLLALVAATGIASSSDRHRRGSPLSATRRAEIGVGLTPIRFPDSSDPRGDIDSADGRGSDWGPRRSASYVAHPPSTRPGAKNRCGGPAIASTPRKGVDGDLRRRADADRNEDGADAAIDVQLTTRLVNQPAT